MRIETVGNATLYLGDCREILPTLHMVDAVVTDPPFGIGFKYESHIDDPAEYEVFLMSVIAATRAISKPGAVHFWFQAMKRCAEFHRWFPPGWRIYAAAKNFVQMRPTAMQYAYDPVVVWWEEGEAYRAGKERLARDFYVANTAAVVSDPTAIQRGHPAPRPLDQMKEIVASYTRPGGTVLDPFMGSGTTGVACLNLGRKFIGIEMEPKYFEIACTRIEQATRQQRLFA